MLLACLPQVFFCKYNDPSCEKNVGDRRLELGLLALHGPLHHAHGS